MSANSCSLFRDQNSPGNIFQGTHADICSICPQILLQWIPLHGRFATWEIVCATNILGIIPHILVSRASTAAPQRILKKGVHQMPHESVWACRYKLLSFLLIANEKPLAFLNDFICSFLWFNPQLFNCGETAPKSLLDLSGEDQVHLLFLCSDSILASFFLRTLTSSLFHHRNIETPIN